MLFSKYQKLKAGSIVKFINGARFFLKKLLSLQIYPGFRQLLTAEGYKSCLPNCTDLDAAVEMYHNLKAQGESYKKLEKEFKVVALRLGDVTLPPYRPLSRTEASALGKLLQTKTRTKWLTRIAYGSFATVYRLKKCADVMEAMHMTG